jgi:hypothetical protein
VLWKILSDFGLLDAVTADSLSHINLIDPMFMAPERNSVPRTARPATSPPSSDDMMSSVTIFRRQVPPRGEGLFLL